MLQIEKSEQREWSALCYQSQFVAKFEPLHNYTNTLLPVLNSYDRRHYKTHEKT